MRNNTLPQLQKHSLSLPRQRGSVAVEMAFLAVVMFLIMAGIVEFSRAFWYYNALDKATRDAARFMSSVPSVQISDSTQAAAAVDVAKSLALITANGAKVSPTIVAADIDILCDGAACTGTKPTNVTATVTLVMNLGSIFPFVTVTNGSYGDVTLAPSTTMRYMN
jgi:Flp pilus assembly protein TadG